MTDRNYLNLHESQLDSYIYRIISISRLKELFSKNENVLVSPEKWDDPFENFILKSNVRMDTGEIGNIGFCNDYYGQCWSLHKASDAMWRIYSPKSDGIRIRTTVRKLVESLSQQLEQWANVQCHFGKVEYLPNKKLLKFANTILTGMPQPTQLAQTLLVKRPAFKHEKEVRLIYFDKDSSIKNGLFKYQIEPHSLIDQIMIDPRLSKPEANKVKQDIITTTGYKGVIKRSLLYTAPENMVFNFG